MSILPLLLIAPALVAQAPAPSVDQILAKHHAAKGGLAKIKALRSAKITARILQGPTEIGLQMEVGQDTFRMEVSVQGMTQITAYDGKGGWKIDPFQGQGSGKNAEVLAADELKGAANQADFQGPLVDYAAKGHKIEYLGQENVEGAPTHKLKVLLKNGDVQTFFLDTDNYLEVKQVSNRKFRDQETEFETFFGDFRDVAGVLLPFGLEQGMAGAPQRAKIVVDKIEPNVTIDPARLKMPAAAAPTPAAVKPPSR